MNFMDAVKTGYNKYASFSGRACRSEYWFFMLFFISIYFMLAFLGGITESSTILIGLVVFLIGSLLPTIAISVRRLHDIDKSGWWLLISLVPFISLVLLYFYSLKGTDGGNQYGADPLA